MKGKQTSAQSSTVSVEHPDNTIMNAIIRPRNIAIVIAVMAIFIISFYLFT